MTDRADSSGPSRRASLIAFVPHGLTIGAVVLGWQIIVQPFMQRAPVETAMGIAPASPLVLRRAAEAELVAGRDANSAGLARDALGRSPFDVRALRIVGLTEARAGRRDVADDLLTLAGNWSLRDDPTHAWLVEHRLRRGDYASAFAHADTLARRREDLHPQLFQLFSAAAARDPQRVLPVLAALLVPQPPWRSAFLSSLNGTSENLQTAANLAVLLQSSSVPLTNAELQRFYRSAAESGHIDLLKTVRARLDRPRADSGLANGGFDDPTAPEPFQWTLVQAVGATAEIIAKDTDPTDLALRVEYDGYSAASLARQRIFLAVGRYRFRVESRTETGEPAGRMAWTVTCLPSGDTLASVPAAPVTSGRNRDWATIMMNFSVPSACPSQWLELRGLPMDRRSPMVLWFDQTAISPLDTAEN